MMRRIELRIVLLLLVSLFAVHFAFAGVTIVTPEEARLQAGVSLIRYVAFETPLLEGWTGATLGNEVLLWDPGNAHRDPMPLMYDFTVMVNNENAGRVSVAATPLLGTAQLSLTLGAREYDIENSLNEALELMPVLHPEAVVHNALPVVYQYPKVAALINFEDPATSRMYKAFIELPTLEEIACWPVVQSGAPSSPPHHHTQGSTSHRLDPANGLDQLAEPGYGAPGASEVVSIYAQLSDKELWDRSSAYAVENEVLAMTAETLYANMAIDVTLYDPIPIWLWPEAKALMEQVGWYQADQNILPTYKCKLIKQEQGDWCARAVAQMIMYYHFNMLFHTQTEIDFYMNAYGWDKDWHYAMTRYYSHKMGLTDSEFDPNITASTMTDNTKQEAGWNRLKQEIDDGYPLCDGIPVHARMCMGYNVYGHNAFMSKYDVGIYDPEQYNGGVRWETGWIDTSFGLGQIAQRYFLFIARFAP